MSFVINKVCQQCHTTFKANRRAQPLPTLCPWCQIETQEQFTIEGITFHREEQDESRLWNYRYRSELIQEGGEDYPITALLYVGRRQSEQQDLAWNGRLFLGSHCIYIDALEHSTKEEALGRCFSRLNDESIQRTIQVFVAFERQKTDS